MNKGSQTLETDQNFLLPFLIWMYRMEASTRGVRVPKQKRGQETKQQIIDAGLRLFSKKGIQKTNSKEIADEAGVAIGSFYAYFKDKKVLFIELLKEHLEEISNSLRIQDMEDLIEEHSGEQLISVFIENVIKAHQISPGFHREIGIIRNSDPDIDMLVSKYEESIVKNTMKLLSKHSDKIRVQDMEAAAVIVNSSIEETVHKMKFSNLLIDKTRLTTELIDMVTRYLFY